MEQLPQPVGSGSLVGGSPPPQPSRFGYFNISYSKNEDYVETNIRIGKSVETVDDVNEVMDRFLEELKKVI